MMGCFLDYLVLLFLGISSGQDSDAANLQQTRGQIFPDPDYSETSSFSNAEQLTVNGEGTAMWLSSNDVELRYE